MFPTRTGPLSLLGTGSVEDNFTSNDPDKHTKGLRNLWKTIRGDHLGRGDGNHGLEPEDLELQRVLFVTRKKEPEQPGAIGGQDSQPPVDCKNDLSKQKVDPETANNFVDLSQSTTESSSDDDSSSDTDSSES